MNVHPVALSYNFMLQHQLK
uniref:Uncharacterized protein n=1 Tax=Anguilla anguilla TaxID=7936 RepID=A0A0E9P9I4_ANGAN